MLYLDTRYTLNNNKQATPAKTQVGKQLVFSNSLKYIELRNQL